MKPEDMRVCVLRTEGTQCDRETVRALNKAFMSLYSQKPYEYQFEVVRDKKLYTGEKTLDSYDAFIIPGGFSYGDRVRSGAILGKIMMGEIGNDIKKFYDNLKPIMGICNGFQVLVEAGLLPALDGISSTPEAALTVNMPPGYHCEWMFMKNYSQKNIFTRNISRDKVNRIPVANGEGRFVLPRDREKRMLERMIANDQIVLRYTTPDGGPANGRSPYNYNQTLFDIASVGNPEGNVIGLMPHPERAIDGCQLPDWTRNGLRDGDGVDIFKGMFSYMRVL